MLPIVLALAALLQEPGPTLATTRQLDLAVEVERALPRTFELRRDLHAHPELGERETRTAGLVAARLRELGLEVREGIAVTGVVGVLRGGRPGATVAYRADMDALPITEATGLPYASTATDVWDGAEVGVMHACGHDVHTAIALGLADVLASERIRNQLPGTVLFVFQPAEEGHPDPGPHGAERMLLEGAFDEPRPAAVLGLHVNPKLHVGQVALRPGAALAAVDRFRVHVQGKQAHGAYPHDGVDPVVIASHVVVALQTIVARNVDTHEQAVVTVGKLEAGNRFNVIPDTAELVGTVRTHDEDVQRLVHERLRAIATGVAAALGGAAEVEIETITPVTSNDPELVASLLPVVSSFLGAEAVVDERPHMGGEDFAFFAREVPGLYYFLGTSDPEDEQPALVHTPGFAPDEDCIRYGLGLSARLVLTWLEAHAGEGE